MTTPLRKLAIAGLIVGILSVFMVIYLFIYLFTKMEGMEGVVVAKGYAIMSLVLLLLLFSLGALYGFWIAANLNKADTMLGEIFRRCPLCFDTLIDIKLSPPKLIDIEPYPPKSKVLCRNCGAQWEWAVSPWSKRLTRLSITDYGNALSAEERSLVPDTDSPEHWYGWAKERFRQMRPSSPPPLAPQGQTLFCRFCGRRNLPDAKFCSACGRELSGDSKA